MVAGRRARGNGKPKGNRGAALIVVLVTVAILTTVVVDFVFGTRVELHMATNIRDEVRAYYLARGGIDLARLALNLQAQVDSIARGFGANANIQVWQYVNQFLGAFNSGRVDLPVATMDLSGIKGLGNFKGAFAVDVEAEDGKINLNALAAAPEQRLATIARLTYLMAPAQNRDLFETRHSDGDYADVPDVIAALIDWVDGDKDLTTMGADGQYGPSGAGQEDNRYSRFGSEVKARNAPMDTVQEVHLVKGIDDAWWDAFGASLTVYPSTKVNVNTANLQLLAVLLCSHLANPMDPLCSFASPAAEMRLLEIVQAIDMERRFRMMLFMTPFATTEAFVNFLRNGHGTIPWVQFEPLPPTTLDFGRLASDITVESPRVFSLRGEGRVGNTVKRIHAVVDIKNHSRLLYWREF